MRGITSTYLANFQFSQIEWVKYRSIMKVNGKCPLTLIRINICWNIYSSLVTDKGGAELHFMYHFCLSPQDTCASLFWNFMSSFNFCIWKLIKFCPQWQSCELFSYRSCWGLGLISYGTKKMDKKCSTSISVSRVLPSFFNNFTGYNLEKTTTTNANNQTNKKPTHKPKQNKGWILRLVLQL